MHVPSTVQVAEMFSPIEELASDLGLHTALVHLYKGKHEFCVQMQGALKGGKQTLGNFLLHRVEFQAR